MFTWGSPFWAKYTFDWGYTLAPYAVFGVILILLGICLLQFRIAEGSWSLLIVSPLKADLTNGISDPYVNIHVSKRENWLDTALGWI